MVISQITLLFESQILKGNKFLSILEALEQLEGHEKNIRFKDLLHICEEFFGESRINGSHHYFKTPWSGNPRINLQTAKGKAKAYQVKQVIEALKRLQSERG